MFNKTRKDKNNQMSGKVFNPYKSQNLRTTQASVVSLFKMDL